MKTIQLTDNNWELVIKQAIAVLEKGGLIIYPTETCYGVGVDGTNPQAVTKLLRYKNRPTGKPISIAVTDQEMASTYVIVNNTAKNLYKNFLPGPITVISQSNNTVAKGIAAEDNSLGVRIPDYAFTLELIKQYGKPITATSANLSGKKTPYTIEDILDNASEKNKKLIDLIIDAGELPHNPPSTVVDTRLNDEKVLRQGSYSQQPKQTLISSSPKETIRLGKELMQKHQKKLESNCIVFALSGNLGAGKTQFAKGVAQALSINEDITSPTFTIVKEYKFSQANHENIKKEASIQSNAVDSSSSTQNDGVLYHIDTWRMEDTASLDDIGFTDMINKGNVIVIEWVEKLQKVLQSLNKSEVQVISVTISDDKQKRTLYIS